MWTEPCSRCPDYADGLLSCSIMFWELIHAILYVNNSLPFIVEQCSTLPLDQSFHCIISYLYLSSNRKYTHGARQSIHTTRRTVSSLALNPILHPASSSLLRMKSTWNSTVVRHQRCFDSLHPRAHGSLERDHSRQERCLVWVSKYL